MAGIPFPSKQFFSLARGEVVHFGILAIGVARLPEDSIGNFHLTLTNLIVGSSIQIETLTGTPVDFKVATLTSESFTLPAYSTGDPKNSLVIKIRKGSSTPYYQPYETQTTAIVGSQSIFISQIPDE